MPDVNPAPAAQRPLTPEDLPDFLRFSPVPVKSRRDGWTAQLQLRFIVALARGAGVDEAARAVGRSRQSAYELRRRGGAEAFGRAWEAAVDFAREARAAGASRGFASSSGVEILLVPRYYRGRLIGFVQREDLSGVMARLGRLDRIAARLEAQHGPAALRAAIERFGPLIGQR